MNVEDESVSEKKRLTVSQAKKIAKTYLRGILGEDDVVEEEGVICYRGPIFRRDYMLTFEEGFDENSMILSVKRIPVTSEGVEGLDWIDQIYACTYMGFFVDYLPGDEDFVYPFFKYNYWFSTLNSKNELESILGQAAISDVSMCEMVFQEALKIYLEE